MTKKLKYGTKLMEIGEQKMVHLENDSMKNFWTKRQIAYTDAKLHDRKVSVNKVDGGFIMTRVE